jgi:hypothetical protein
LEKEMGVVFGVIRKHAFARIISKYVDGEPVYLGEEKSLQLFNFFVEKGYVIDAYSGDTRSPIPVISVHSVGNLQYRRQS